MTKNNNISLKELRLILDKAERTLRSAESLYDDDFIESAASRAYYSAFMISKLFCHPITKHTQNIPQ